MTADVELLPLPAIERWEVTGDYAFPTATDPEGHAVDYDAHVEAMQSYARANVAHATAALNAEIEALRAEVERLKFGMNFLQQKYDERTAHVIVHRGAAIACSDAVLAAYSDEHGRAELLAEALREFLPLERGVSNCAGHGINSGMRTKGEKLVAFITALNPTAAQENGACHHINTVRGEDGMRWCQHCRQQLAQENDDA